MPRSRRSESAGSRVVSQFLQFVGLVISARLLIPSDYGNSAVIAPILAFGGLLANLGLSSAIIHARRVTEELLSTVFWINAVAGVVLTGIVAALAMPLSHLFRNPRLAPLLVLAGLIFTINLGIVHNALLERTLRFKTIALLETGCVLLSVITIVVTAARGAGPYSLVWGPLVNQGATTLCLWATVRWRPRARPTWKTTQLLWTVSRGLTGYNILEFWSRNSDNLMLARFVSLAELGNYNTNTSQFTNSDLYGLFLPQVRLDFAAPVTSGQVPLRFTGVPGLAYAIQATTNLLATNTVWITLTTSNTLGGTFDFTDTNAASSSRRFYRAVLP